VVLEALANYHLWFGHGSFGYAGSLNDLIILNLLPLMESLVDGTFVAMENSSQHLPHMKLLDYSFAGYLH
jgi:hypothetical protein